MSTRKSRRRRAPAAQRSSRTKARLSAEQLEVRLLLSINAADYSYTASNAVALTVAAPGVLANDSDTDSDHITASLSMSATYGTVNLQSDGAFTYTANTGFTGTDQFGYVATDGNGEYSNTGIVTLTVDYGVVSAVDSTKVAVDTINVSRQILSDPWAQSIVAPLPAGGSGGTAISTEPADGAPGTAHNLSLAYNSVAGHPDQVIEGDFQLDMNPAVNDTLTVSGTFNGTQLPATTITTSNLNENDPTVHVAVQADTSTLATGRYPYSLTISGGSMYGTSTINGYANVVNNSASPFGLGWDMPGLYHLYQNNVQGVSAGVLLTDGTGQGYYFTAGSGNAYTSPAGAYAFDTLTSVSGGGWQLVDKYGTTFNFSSSGDLTSRVERTGETTTYNWTNGLLTSIADAFGRSVNLGYTNGLLSSIQDYATSTWSFAHTGTELTSVTEPNPGGGSPLWQYAYSGNYLSSVEDPDSNTTTYTLNSYNRVSGVLLPGGANTSDSSEQDYGYGSTNPNQPANSTLTSGVDPSATDPNGNTSGYETDQLGNVISETDPYGNTETIQRDANGLPTQITLPPPTTGASSPVTTFTHDAMGNETSATGAQPSYGTWTYNSFGEWATFTDTTGKEWIRTFDSHGNVLTETDPSGNKVSFTYDSYGRPLTMTVPAPNNGTGTETTQYVYDPDERLIKIIWPDNNTQLFGYNADDRQTSFTDENSHLTQTNIDVLGRVTSVVNAANGTVSYTYDKAGNVLTTTDEMNNVTSYQYNARNERVQETLPAPATGQSQPVLAWTYDANGNELTSTDALNRVTTYTWDKLNRMATERLPQPTLNQQGPLITFSYDNLSHKVSELNPLSGTTTWAYANTDISQLTSVTLPPPSGSGQGPTTSYGYNADGRQNLVTDAMNHTTTTTFTVDGQVSQTEDSLNHITSYSYGHGSELLSTTDPLNHTSSEEYDARYRLIQTTDANNGVTQITLDPAGNETKLVDSDNNATTWTYNALNEPLTETNAQGTTTWTYSPSSDITSITDADGRVRDFSYDNLHRLVSEQWMSGSTVLATMSYGYDLANQLVSASDPNSAYAFTYDGDGNVLTVDNNGTPNVPHVVLTNTFDQMGNVLTQSATINATADFLNNYSYDGDQDLTMVQQEQQTNGNTVAPKEVDFAYNALAQPTSVVYYNTLSGPRSDVATGAYTYDGGNRLSGLAYTSNGGANKIDTYGWAFNAGDLVTSFTSNDGTAAYAYDPTNQLTSATYTTNSGRHQPANESYSFTANGNRNMTGYSTGSDNLMSSDGTYNYTYDADGNRVTRTQISNTYSTDYKTTYSWDYRDRLTDVQNYDNNGVLKQHVHYIYDVFDHLLATEVDPTGGGSYTQIEHDVLDVSPEVPSAGVPGTALAEPVLSFDGNGNETTRYLEALDRIYAQGAVPSPNQADTVNWDLLDNLGSLRIVLDNSSHVIDEVVYNSSGQVAYESNPSTAHVAGFAGGHVDANTGLVIFYHRPYDPTTGRWLTPDPKSFAAGDANLERYVGNDPVGAADPLGLAGPTYGPPPAPTDPAALAASQAQGALEHQQQQQQISAYTQAMMQQQQAENFRSESLMRWEEAANELVPDNWLNQLKPMDLVGEQTHQLDLGQLLKVPDLIEFALKQNMDVDALSMGIKELKIGKLSASVALELGLNQQVDKIDMGFQLKEILDVPLKIQTAVDLNKAKDAPAFMFILQKPF